jgi:hypothetical protein
MTQFWKLHVHKPSNSNELNPIGTAKYSKDSLQLSAKVRKEKGPNFLKGCETVLPLSRDPTDR